MSDHLEITANHHPGAALLLNTRFDVAFDDLPALGFCSVEGIEAALETLGSGTPKEESGPAGTKERPAKLVLRRGVTGNRDLWEWYAAARDGSDMRRNGKIVILDAGGQPVLQVALRNARPVRWRLSRLDALQPEVLVEEVELFVEILELA
jgi:phage tail-like protein